MRRQYLTLDELAERWRCTPRALRGRIQRGTLPAVRFPGSRPWLVDVETVKRLEQREGQP